MHCTGTFLQYNSIYAFMHFSMSWYAKTETWKHTHTPKKNKLRTQEEDCRFRLNLIGHERTIFYSTVSFQSQLSCVVVARVLLVLVTTVVVVLGAVMTVLVAMFTVAHGDGVPHLRWAWLEVSQTEAGRRGVPSQARRSSKCRWPNRSYSLEGSSAECKKQLRKH